MRTELYRDTGLGLQQIRVAPFPALLRGRSSWMRFPSCCNGQRMVFYAGLGISVSHICHIIRREEQVAYHSPLRDEVDQASIVNLAHGMQLSSLPNNGPCTHQFSFFIAI